VGRRAAPPTLRFYRWSPATISLGYFQEYSDYENLPPPAGELAVVRRQTGGGAILHDLELTYSLTVPLDHPLIAGQNPAVLYDHVHTAIATRLKTQDVPVANGPAGTGGCSHRGPFFCFARHSCFDLLADGKKLLGSAQRRTAGAVLQHGSLILSRRFDQQPCAAVADFTTYDVESHLDPLAEDIARGPVEHADGLNAFERSLLSDLRIKYAGAEWTQRR
jgi:lipoate-protein ligase A